MADNKEVAEAVPFEFFPFSKTILENFSIKGSVSARATKVLRISQGAGMPSWMHSLPNFCHHRPGDHRRHSAGELLESAGGLIAPCPRQGYGIFGTSPELPLLL